MIIWQELYLPTQSFSLNPYLMSVSSPWHRTGDAAGSYGWWGHLFLCGVWIQGTWPSCPAIFSAWLAVSWWWEHLCFFEHTGMHSYTHIQYSGVIFSIKGMNHYHIESWCAQSVACIRLYGIVSAQVCVWFIVFKILCWGSCTWLLYVYPEKFFV